MRSNFQRAVVAVTMLFVTGAGLTATVFAQTTEPAKRGGAWAQTYLGRAADPAARFGQLPNGMRYAIMKNATPAKQASLRLRIGSGAMSERDDQQGLAHFLEHMAFKGSAHVPGTDLIQILQRKGLAFGPDTNAGTFQDETVYQFNLPENDEDSLNTGLTLLREIGSELTLSQAAMDPERGVVLSEERARDTPALQEAISQLNFQLAGQLAPRRIPIGKVDVLQHAPVSLIRQFYDSEYRPDNATLVAVGDFDVDRMEARIKAKFSDWRARTPGPRAIDFGQVMRRGSDAGVFIKPGAPQMLSISWVKPYDVTADTLARERRDTVALLALTVLNRRLDREAQASDAPFTAAGASRSNVLRSADITQISVQFKAGEWQKGLDAAIAEERRLVQFGVRQEELDREITQFRTILANAAAGAATRPTPALADALVRADNDEDVFTSPAQNLAEFEAEVRGLTAAEVSAAAMRLFTGSGPLVFVSGSVPIVGDAQGVKAELAAAEARPLAAAAAEVTRAWPYRSFGTPGRVVSRHEIADLGITDVRFANGVRLLVKPTSFAKDEIQVSVRVGAGRLGVSKSLSRSIWAVSGLAPVFTLGGTKDLTLEEIQRLTNAKVASVQLIMDDDAFLLSGTTRPQDLDTQMELLTAYTTRPGLRPQAFDRVKAALLAQLPQIDATAAGVLQREAGPALHDGDQRFRTIPTAEALAASLPADLDALLANSLENGPIDVNVVGATTVDEAIAAVARTYGALPPRAARRPAAFSVAFPAGGPIPIVFNHHGRADQSYAFEAWPTDDFYADPQESRIIGVLSEVIKNRLTDRLRVTQGATYSPAAESTNSEVYRGYGFLDAYVETPVDKVPGFFAEVDKIAAELRDVPLSADELQRAKAPRIEQRIKARQTNAYWLSALGNVDRDARSQDAIRNLVTGVQMVTAEDVRAAARKYLRDAKAYRLIVRATPKPG